VKLKTPLWATLAVLLALVFGGLACDGKKAAAPSTAAKSLATETTIPRDTAKGHYEPNATPYPQDKPVHVDGYYRKNGTYVQPYNRGLPGEGKSKRSKGH
jgi:hypothetical protein